MPSNPSVVASGGPSGAVLGRESPVPGGKKPLEKKHSHNPLKFFRAVSHHQEVTEEKKKHPFSLRSRSNTLRNEDIRPPSPALSDVKRTHMANPFVKSTTFDVLGTGNDIAAPRNSTSTPGLSRAASFSHIKDHNKPVYNPYGINSRTPSTYSISTTSDDDKKHLLTNPIKDPNDALPDDLKQEFSSLIDGFQFPDNNKTRKKLGDGASACIFLVQNKKTFKSFALKKFILLPHETDDEFYKRAIKEFIIAKRLSHNKHIVTTYYCLKIQTTTNITRGWGFILDYCVGGDLFSLVTRPGWKSYSIVEKFCIFKQLVLGVQFIHSKGIVHRDLKPENVLIDSHGLVKLTDFGIAEYVHEDENDLNSPMKKFQNFVGSPPYVPPELMDIKKTHSGEYDPFKLDLWGVGVILFVLIYQNAPFRSASATDQLYRDFVSSYKTYIGSNPSFRFGDVNHGPGIEFKYAKEFHNPGASRVAWRLCDYDPQYRYTMSDILKDPWFIQLECCCCDEEEEEEEENQEFDPQVQRHSSFDSIIPSPSPSPLISGKSMLDFNDHATASPSMIPNDLESSSEPMLLTTSQAALEPVAEVRNESECTTALLGSAPSMCDSIVPNSPIPINSTSELTLENLKINSESFPSNESNLTIQKQSSNTATFQRAASFSSIMSSRSVRSVRSSSSDQLTGKRKIKHHHLDVSNVSNHGAVKR